jgi:hypothetical protein
MDQKKKPIFSNPSAWAFFYFQPFKSFKSARKATIAGRATKR